MKINQGLTIFVLSGIFMIVFFLLKITGYSVFLVALTFSLFRMDNYWVIGGKSNGKKKK